MAAIKNVLLILSGFLIVFCGCEEHARESGVSDSELDGWACAVVGISCEGGNALPDDAPKPGDQCPTCNGTGKVGDGRVFSTCLDCNGQGVVPPPGTPDPEPTEPLTVAIATPPIGADCDPITGL